MNQEQRFAIYISVVVVVYLLRLRAELAYFRQRTGDTSLSFADFMAADHTGDIRLLFTEQGDTSAERARKQLLLLNALGLLIVLAFVVSSFVLYR